MLKAGEYSPNNPLIRSERTSGDAFLGLGEYERRRNTLRKIRQQQYKEYLDEQAKKKQEAKEKAERERREREERERLRAERQRERLERERERSPELRRTNFNHAYESSNSNVSSPKNPYSNKVDTGVQVEFFGRPLSVAVQTDSSELFPLPSPLHTKLTEAERELSPRTVVEADDRTIRPTNEQWEKRDSYQDRSIQPESEDWEKKDIYQDAQLPLVKKSNREKLVSDLRHTYMPSIFDADAIQLRNLQAEKEAAERRQYYQRELKNQILEQQRIKEERKAREKMLEQAEMRRLEEQLRMLKVAQEKEIGRQDVMADAMKESATEYEMKRKSLQKEIDLEQNMLRSKSQPCRVLPKRPTYTSQSDSNQNISKLPFYYPKIDELSNEIYSEGKKQQFSLNNPENTVFSSNYDVESYLRKNLNPSKETLNMFNDVELDRMKTTENKHKRFSFSNEYNNNFDKNQNESPNLPNLGKSPEINKKIATIRRKDTKDKIDETLPIPILRHSIKNDVTLQNNSAKLSDAMKLVDDKWKVPAVQKNILKSMPSKDGKNISILTQLGSIRRQLQLEQLKLDEMLDKDQKV